MRSPLMNPLPGTVVVLGAMLGCAGVQASRPAPGKIENGTFTSARPAADTYGPNPAYECHSPGLIKLLQVDLAEGKPATEATPAPDGALCAVAETVLGWDKLDAVPPQIADFLTWHFGLLSPPRPKMVITMQETEDPADISQALHATLAQFAKTAAHPRFGVATLRVAKEKGESRRGVDPGTGTGSTRVALVMQDVPGDLAPFPTHLAPNTQATLSGHVPADVDNAKVYVSDPVGHLDVTPVPASRELKVDVHCAEKAGRIQVEVRGEQKGAAHALFGFPAYCGGAAPTAVAVPKPEDWPADPVGQGKKVAEMINAERQAAGLNPLVWDDTVASVAQTATERLREDVNKGVSAPVDPVPLLKKAEVSSPLVLESPAQALTTLDAQTQFSMSPVLRANYMNPEVTHVGVGVAPNKEADGRSSVFVTELFIRQLPPVDVATVVPGLQAKIAEKRAAAHLPALTNDPTFDSLAQQYSKELANNHGTISDERSRQVLAPVYKGYKAINILSGAKVNPLDFAEEKSLVGNVKLVGIGAAQGTSPTLGKNTVFVTILIGSKR